MNVNDGGRRGLGLCEVAFALIYPLCFIGTVTVRAKHHPTFELLCGSSAGLAEGQRCIILENRRDHCPYGSVVSSIGLVLFYFLVSLCRLL